MGDKSTSSRNKSPITSPGSSSASEDSSKVNALKNMREFYRRDLIQIPLINKIPHPAITQKSGLPTVTLEFDTGAYPNIEYIAGNRMSVYPVNGKEQVASICSKIVDDISKDKDKQPNSIWAKSFMRGECNLRFALLHYFDLTSSPSRDLLKLIRDSCSSQEQKQRLNQLVTDTQAYNTWVTSGLRTLKTTLDEFPSAILSARLLFNELTPMQPRLYSISAIKSSKRFKAEIIVVQHRFSVVNINSPSAIEAAAKAAAAVSSFNPIPSSMGGKSAIEGAASERSVSKAANTSKLMPSMTLGGGTGGPGGFDNQYEGLCSTYLINLSLNESVICEFVENPRFTLKGSRERPMVMLGQDTGLFAFRTFWQQRNLEFDRAQIFYSMFKDLAPKRFGDMTLIIVTGGKTRAEELFKREIATMLTNKVINSAMYVSKQSLLLYALQTVAGQTQGQQLEANVQKELDDLGTQLAKMMIEKNGTLYTCCDATITEAIEKLTIDSIVKCHKYTREKTQSIVTKMKGKAAKDVNTKFLFQLQNAFEKSQYIQEVYEI